MWSHDEKYPRFVSREVPAVAGTKDVNIHYQGFFVFYGEKAQSQPGGKPKKTKESAVVDLTIVVPPASRFAFKGRKATCTLCWSQLQCSDLQKVYDHLKKVFHAPPLYYSSAALQLTTSFLSFNVVQVHLEKRAVMHITAAECAVLNDSHMRAVLNRKENVAAPTASDGRIRLGKRNHQTALGFPSK